MDEARIVEADTGKQNFTVVPESHYIAMHILCENCREQFCFSENEQKHWYEELRFWIDSVPKQCPRCRKESRGHGRSA